MPSYVSIVKFKGKTKNRRIRENLTFYSILLLAMIAQIVICKITHLLYILCLFRTRFFIP